MGELIADGGKCRMFKKVHDNNLRIQIARSIKQLRVLQADNNEPVPGAYVKVCGEIPQRIDKRTGQPEVHHYKDGYTDFRGRFDYYKLSASQMMDTKRVSVLVMTEHAGCSVTEIKL